MCYVNRKTVVRYWNEYAEQQKLLDIAEPGEISKIQETICASPSYSIEARTPRKYSEESDAFIDELLEAETEKCKLLITKKQCLTQLQIYDLVIERRFSIGESTVTNKIREKRNRHKEFFIRQEYLYVDHLEYDFGEVKLVSNGVLDTYHIAVFYSPAANLRWAYLNKSQKQEVFMDSHIRFF